MKIKTNTKKGYEEVEEGDYINLQFDSSSTRRGRVGKQIAQTLLCGDGQGVAVRDDPGHWISEKGVKYILAPKRGAFTDVNNDVCSTLTAKGQSNWTGSFVSPDIDHIKHNDNIGGTKPTDIYLKNGEKITSDDDVSHLRIRKLTPLETWRLMDFDDEDFMKASAKVSNTQLYSQSGNSIVVNCLVAIFGQLFEGKEEAYKDI